MSSERDNPWVHRLAVLTALTSLLPIGVGAIVTTLGAGMAFPDWPTSDGHNMLSYPWLQSAGDKFVEHGHRLAGMLIGVMSIILAAVVWRFESRNWVRWLGVAVLLSVIGQGLLGGMRVRMDERALAMIHGVSAAFVFSLIAIVALVTSRTWLQQKAPPHVTRLPTVAVAVMPVLILSQYLLGGMLRHFGTMLHEHMGFACVVLVGSLATAISAHRSGLSWLRRPAWTMFALTVLQVSLGGAAWATKYGLASIGYVAVQHSPLQIAVRTTHTVLAMLVLATSIVLAVRVCRLVWLAKRGMSAAPVVGDLLNAARVGGGAA